jgi:hypothetical protein
MKPKLLPGIALVLSVGLFGCSTIRQPGAHAGPPVVLGRALYDVDRDGRKDCLSLIWVAGRHTLQDKEPSCADGEKYGGKFIFRVKSAGGKIVDTPFDSLGDDLPDFFFAYAGVQPIYIADYNHDGQPDFNILSYGGCRWLDYDLFTILPSGKIERLKTKAIADPKIGPASQLGIPKSFGEISTDQFQLTPAGFFYESGSRDETALIFSDWNKDEKVFYERQQIIQLRQ